MRVIHGIWWIRDLGVKFSRIVADTVCMGITRNILVIAIMVLVATTSTAHAGKQHASTSDPSAVAANTCPWHAQRITVSKKCLRSSEFAYKQFRSKGDRGHNYAQKCKTTRGRNWYKCSIVGTGKMRDSICYTKHRDNRPLAKKCTRAKTSRMIFMLPRTMKGMKQLRSTLYKIADRQNLFIQCSQHGTSGVGMVRNVSCNEAKAVIQNKPSSWSCQSNKHCNRGNQTIDARAHSESGIRYETDNIWMPAWLRGAEQFYGVATSSKG